MENGLTNGKKRIKQFLMIFSAVKKMRGKRGIFNEKALNYEELELINQEFARLFSKVFFARQGVGGKLSSCRII